MKKIHKFTSDQKLAWWGYGEWVEEPDEVTFEHEGFKCRIIRAAALEGLSPTQYMFGGHLCGYVQVPESHPWYNVGSIFDAQADIHGGITFADYAFEEGEFWAGFDCGHSFDIIPSMIAMKKKIREDMLEKHSWIPERIPIFQECYKNIDYCILECKLLAEQAKVAQEVKK